MAEKITAELRTEFGKGAARRIRRADKVPAVLYGHGGQPQHLTLPGHETMLALKHGGSNALLEIELDGSKQLALTKQVQADPIKGFLEHIDFVIVKKGEKVTVDVQLHVVGEADHDTMVQLEHQTISLEAEATHIPEYIEVSVAGLKAGSHITAGELTLPKGSTLSGVEDDALVVNITGAPSTEEIEAELEEAEAEVGIERDESDDEVESAGEASDEGDEESSDSE